MPRVRKIPKSRLRGRPLKQRATFRARLKPKSRVPGVAKAPPRKRIKPRPTASTRRERRLKKEGQPFLRAAQTKYGRGQRKKFKYRLQPGEDEGAGWRRYAKARAKAAAPPNPLDMMGHLPPFKPPPGVGFQTPGPAPNAPLDTGAPVVPAGPKPPMPTGTMDMPLQMPGGAYENDLAEMQQRLLGQLGMGSSQLEEMLRYYLQQMTAQQAQGAGIGGPMGV